MKNKRASTNALSFLKEKLFWVFLAPTLKIIECTMELAVPFLVREIIDQGLTEPVPGMNYGAHYGDTTYIFTLASLVFVFAVLGFLFTMCSQYLASKVSTDYAYDLKKAIYGKLTASSSKTIDEFGKGRILNLITVDSYSLQVGVQLFMRLMVRAPFMVVGSVVAGFLVNVYAGIAISIALLCCAITIFFVLRCTPKRYALLNAELDAITTLGDGATSGSRVLRAFNQEEASLEKFKEQSEKYRRVSKTINRINSFINPLTFGFVNLAVVAMIYLGSFAYPKTGLSVGSIVALISFLTQSLSALLQFTRLVTSMGKAFASKRRVDAFFAKEEPIQDGIGGKESEDPDAPIFELRDVCLSFGGEKYAVENINLVINEGESIGLIGGTGSGKSTVLSLLERFYDPTIGEVLYRGKPLPTYALSTFRSEIALVSQKPQIFKGTLRDNLTLGAQNLSESEIQEAIEDSLCSEYFCHYADGLDHLVEEGGANLSGGQKQRLLIARALLSKRPLLILDDATSALDYKSDLKVRRNIAKRELTTVLVSQRATSIKDCDRIYVLDAGKIVGVGTHEELLGSCDIYREIYEAQVNAQ